MSKNIEAQENLRDSSKKACILTMKLLTKRYDRQVRCELHNLDKKSEESLHCKIIFI